MVPDTADQKRRRTDLSEDRASEILLLENEILESRTRYNNILTLLGLITDDNTSGEQQNLASVSLCRVFCGLLSLGELNSKKGKPENEAKISKWLEDNLKQFEDALIRRLQSGDQGLQITALTLLMRLLKHKAKILPSSGLIWQGEVFQSMAHTLMNASIDSAVRHEFVSNYFAKFVDVRHQMLLYITDGLNLQDVRISVSSIISILSTILPPDESEGDSSPFFLEPSSGSKSYSLNAQKKQIQKSWIMIMRQDLTKGHRKMLLDQMSRQITPWFIKTEMLMDFLTDSFNMGGSISLMALSGLFHLMEQKNLDYPQFYPKLYSLLDADILHSKHRSRFFRLLGIFLSSTHLPAALVASFIKRLSRLSLQAPPSAIVVIVPWIYNLLKIHPTCTFLIHRKSILDPADEERRGDPFNMDEADPMETEAIESSLWEIHTLQSHYHPNVAAIAKIISEQFTRQEYNLEDFLDHSYATIIQAELAKGLKRPPEIEYEIPKRIFTKHERDSDTEDSLLVQLWNFK